MRHLATTACVTLAVLSLCACGGDRPSVEDFLPPPDPVPGQVQALLERCAVPDLERLFELLDVFDALLNPAAEDPPLMFTGLRIIDGCIDWVLDADADGVTDVSGSFCFLDSAGLPIFPFNPINLGNGVDEVADLLAGLPSGTTVVVSFSQDGVGVGALNVQFIDGSAQTGSGTVTYTHADCTTVYGFTDVQAQNLLAPLPNALVTINLDSDDGAATGTLSMNGTRDAVLSLTKDDRVLVYTLDLETFQLRGFQDPLD